MDSCSLDTKPSNEWDSQDIAGLAVIRRCRKILVDCRVDIQTDIGTPRAVMDWI